MSLFPPISLADFGAIIAGVSFLGAAVQDLRTRQVYDFWWAPIFLGAILLFPSGEDSLSLQLLARGFLFIPLAALVFAEVGAKKWPMADGLGVFALYLASGAQASWSFLAFGVLGLGVYLLGKREYPWLPLIFVAWLSVFVLFRV